MKTAAVLTVAVVANSLGNVCLSKGMRGFAAEAGGGAWAISIVRHAVTDPWVIVGVLLLVIFLSCYLMALSWADLSFVLPATAPAYILTAIFSKVFLNEVISAPRWAGTFLIVAGTCLVARTYTPRAGTVPKESSAAPEELLPGTETGRRARR
ncbi:MAG TPA: EamA family transporter [Anaerolineales bacterium]|jgi:drug/metabolite transporter (DMT)-like permease